jgi:hypothetical protein
VCTHCVRKWATQPAKNASENQSTCPLGACKNRQEKSGFQRSCLLSETTVAHLVQATKFVIPAALDSGPTYTRPGHFQRAARALISQQSNHSLRPMFAVFSIYKGTIFDLACPFNPASPETQCHEPRIYSLSSPHGATCTIIDNLTKRRLRLHATRIKRGRPRLGKSSNPERSQSRDVATEYNSAKKKKLMKSARRCTVLIRMVLLQIPSSQCSALVTQFRTPLPRISRYLPSANPGS